MAKYCNLYMLALVAKRSQRWKTFNFKWKVVLSSCLRK